MFGLESWKMDIEDETNDEAIEIDDWVTQRPKSLIYPITKLELD